MRKFSGFLLLVMALGLGVSSCVKNPYEPSVGGPNNNGTSYLGTIEVSGPNVLFSPTSLASITTGFGGPILISWGGASKTATGTSQPTPVFTASCPIPCNNIWLKNMDGIGGQSGLFGVNDYYIRWAGHKGPDATNDFSSMTMYLVGNQVPYDLSPKNYRGFVFFARGHGNFYVSLAGSELGDPYAGYNFYTKGFGSELTGDGQWHQITVLFSEMTQLYGQAVDLNNVLTKCYGLQFDQQPPLSQDFQLDVDYVRFF